MDRARKWQASRELVNIGHRGASLHAPENTLASFARAIELGADAIELDVHATREGVVVVHHDPSLRVPGRDGGTRQLRIGGATLNEIGRAAGDASAKIPTLREVLDLVANRVPVYVEVKARGIEELVVSCVREYSTRCAVHAFDHRIARRVHALAPEIPTGLLLSSYLLDPARALRGAGARDLWQQWDLIDEPLVADVHRYGGRVVAWTVNEAAAARTLAGWGVDALCTDRVPDIRAAVAPPEG